MSYGVPQSYLCGCSYYMGNQKHYLPQVQLSAHTTILSNTSRTTLKQTFSNPSPNSVKQCTYMFPLYDGVSVVAFTCRIGSRVLRGLVKERSQAKATFDAAVSRGETAGILEQLPDASDVFSSRLGNIPANEKVHVEITYVGELKHDAEADGIRFNLPTRIAPRYGATSTTQLREGSSVQEKGGISITVDASVAEGSFIRGIQSPTHPIAVTMGSTSTAGDAELAMHKASATLSLGSTELGKDFVLIVLTKDTGTPKALLETHPTLLNQRALMLSLVPKFSLPRGNPEIVFVVDRSGSMTSNIPTLVTALKVFLKSIPVGVRFNICSFGFTHSFLWSKSRAYSRESMDEALAHVETFGADYGGTETFAALKATIENRLGDLPCEVMLLTDGEIWQQNALFTYLNDKVRKANCPLRVFALGIGNGVSHALIEGVARAGNGFAQSVDNNEKLDSKVIRMLKGALSPHTTDYSLEVKYHDEEAEEDFEIVEKVTDALKVMLSEEKTAALPEAKQENKPISFFDESAGQSGQEKPPSADNENTEPFAHLPAISVPEIIQTPQAIPPLYPFSRASVYLLFSGESTQKIPRSVILRAKSEHAPLELEMPVEVLKTPGRTIHQLAARKATLELEEGRGWIYEAKGTDNTETLIKDRYPSRFDEMVQREAVRIGVRFQVGGKWCSFVAVKENDNDQEMLDHYAGTGRDVDIVKHDISIKSATACDESDEDMGFGLFDDGPAAPPVRTIPMSMTVNATQASAFCSSTRSAAPGAQQCSLQSGPNRTGGASFGKKVKKLFGGRAGGRSEVTSTATGNMVRGGGAAHMPPPSPFLSKSEADAGLASMEGPAPKTDNDKVHAIIEMQDFEGWWEQSEALMAVLRVEIAEQRTKERCSGTKASADPPQIFTRRVRRDSCPGAS
ncbi:MAG: hypothetical protein LQ338_008111, partial [Usnochroma carphineum]